MNNVKVGDTAGVIEITDSKYYDSLYSKGATGIVTNDFPSGKVMAFLGKLPSYHKGWMVYNECFRKVGRLTVAKVK